MRVCNNCKESINKGDQIFLFFPVIFGQRSFNKNEYIDICNKCFTKAFYEVKK